MDKNNVKMEIWRGIWKNGGFVVFAVQTTRIVIPNKNSKQPSQQTCG